MSNVVKTRVGFLRDIVFSPPQQAGFQIALTSDGAQRFADFHARAAASILTDYGFADVAIVNLGGVESVPADDLSDEDLAAIKSSIASMPEDSK